MMVSGMGGGGAGGAGAGAGGMGARPMVTSEEAESLGLANALGRGGRPVLPLVINSVTHGTVLHHMDEDQLPSEPLRRVYVQVRRSWGASFFLLLLPSGMEVIS